MQRTISLELVEALRVVEQALRQRDVVAVAFVNKEGDYARDGFVELTTSSGVSNEYPVEHKSGRNLYDALEKLDREEEAA